MIGRVLNNRYRLIEVVGMGGMAVVYRAIDMQTNKSVAVKILREEYTGDNEFLRRFDREAKAAAAMAHPNIVALIASGEEEGLRFLVMEYISGPTVKDFIREHGRLSDEEAVAIAVQACRALEHSHDRGIIHRDIKPQNMLIDASGSLKVADFGIARAIGAQTLTATDAGVLGSVHYFSPEQARGGLADSKSDLYSLGIVLYEMLVGQVPFDGDSPVVIALAQVQQQPRRPRRIHSDISVAMEEIVLRALSKDKEQRYQTASEMERDLLRALSQPKGGFVKKPTPPPSSGDTRTVATVGHEAAAGNNAAKGTNNSGGPANARPRSTIMRILLASALLLVVLLLTLAANGRLGGLLSGQVPVPDVTEQAEDEATDKLEAMGFIVDVTYLPSNRVPAGLVSEQFPVGKARAPRGSVVEITVSEGPASAIVPDLWDVPYANVEAELTKYGFVLGDVRYGDSQLGDGRVFRQSPAASTSATRGETIDIWISNPPGIRSVPLVAGLPLEEAEARLMQSGLKLGTVTLLTSSDNEPGTVLNQSPPAEDQVENGSAVELWVSRRGVLKVVSIDDIVIPDAGARVEVVMHKPNGTEETVYSVEHTAAGPRPIDFEIQEEEPCTVRLVTTVGGQIVREMTVEFTEADIEP